MKYKSCAALVASLFLVACAGGGGSDDDDDSVDALVIPLPDANTSGTPDSSTTPTPDAAPGGCTVAVSNSGPSQTGGFYLCGDGSSTCASQDPTAADFVEVLGPINADALPDYIIIEMYSGYGAFSGGLATGSFDLASGDETNYATCGACVRLWSDVDTGAGSGVDDYFQTAGTMTITGFTTGDASNPSTVSGTISGLVLDHVTIDDSNGYQSTIVGDCSANVAEFNFTAELDDYAAE